MLSLIVWTAFLGFFGSQFYSRNPKDPPTAIQQRMLTAHDKLYAIHVGREGRGWAVGKFGIILYTQDGGKSWIQQNSGTTKPLTSVSFADQRHGFAVGGGTILTTSDTGRSWQIKNSGTEDHLLEVHAFSASSAFAVGAFGAAISTKSRV